MNLRRRNLPAPEGSLDQVQVAGLLVEPGGEGVAAGVNRNRRLPSHVKYVKSGGVTAVFGPESGIKEGGRENRPARSRLNSGESARLCPTRIRARRAALPFVDKNHILHDVHWINLAITRRCPHYTPRTEIMNFALDIAPGIVQYYFLQSIKARRSANSMGGVFGLVNESGEWDSPSQSADWSEWSVPVAMDAISPP